MRNAEGNPKTEDGGRKSGAGEGNAEGGMRNAGGNPNTADGNRHSKTAIRKSDTESALLYFYRWRPGSNSALLAHLHRPVVCLPASGWTQIGDYGIKSYRITETFSLPFRHFL